ncbi:MAG: hypothetical protein QNJ46_23710 [Leptolyngbyaceae cyanobacterium MO_188.B28]|nr:hypothetical protein [Leptolyngbyaceae cyanobacterium MO_188.B28]
MSQNQFQIETKEKSQEAKKGITDINPLEGCEALKPHQVDSREAVRAQPIRLAKVVSAKFARRD